MKKLFLLFLLFLLCNACSAGDVPTPTPIPNQSPMDVGPQPKGIWLTAYSTDPAHQPGADPKTTFFVTKNNVIVRRFPDGSYLITFEP